MTLKQSLRSSKKTAEIFKENLQSKVKGKLAHLVLKKDAVPKFLSARTVPIDIEKQVDAEIEKMVKHGYWTPVSQSKWATPLVPVPKKDGGVRICGDYKPTVNTQIEVAHHLLPTVELIASKLSGNTVFSKTDFKTAFQQLELDEASKELCTVNTNKGLFKVNDYLSVLLPVSIMAAHHRQYINWHINPLCLAGIVGRMLTR